MDKKYFYGSVLFLMLILLLAGCGGNTNEQAETDSESNNASQSEEQNTDKKENNGGDKEVAQFTEAESEASETEKDTEEVSSEDTNNQDADSTSESEEEDPLSAYSAKQIEYARVWLELGPNQDIDELNVHHIPAGSLINPNDETSATYPEDVIQLAGSRLVDGSVTYSGNGDGTINVYNVPLRWDSSDAEVDEDFMKEYTEKIIEETELVKIDPGNDEEIIKLIDIMKIHK
ncbi:hypothetical protein [Oceanobacillus kapialis]|uniref:hypothetical protein n=1 Tax=Oceanobacillus kapialis TaxID=481353 RepID=UPI00384DEEB4